MGRRPCTDEASKLTPLMFQILLALSASERHGYAIMQEIEERTDGEFSIGAGSLYRSIKLLVNAGLITEVRPETQVHSQRRYYRLTPNGRQRAAAEARVFHSMVTWARDAHLFEL